MRGKEKYIIAVLCVALLSCMLFIAYALQPKRQEKQPDVEISMRISKDSFVSLLEDKGVKLHGKSLMAVSLFPDTLTLVFDMEAAEKGELSEIRINDRKISYEILSDICENYLDFSCDLVYN